MKNVFNVFSWEISSSKIKVLYVIALSVTVFNLSLKNKKIPIRLVFSKHAAREGIELSSANFHRTIILYILTE